MLAYANLYLHASENQALSETLNSHSASTYGTPPGSIDAYW